MEIKQHITDPVILAEQKAYKASKEKFRASIKELALRQVELVNEIRHSGKQCSKEQTEHCVYRTYLRHLHIAYAIFRGKEIPENYWKLNDKGSDFTLKVESSSHHAQWYKKPNYLLVKKMLDEYVETTTIQYPSK